MDKIEYRFVGGDADDNSLNFYDGSRFLYGAARFLYHVEHFRTTGTVTPHVRTKDINFVIKPAKEGSFIWEVLREMSPTMPSVMESAIKVPLETMFSWAWSHILPEKKKISVNPLQLEQEKLNKQLRKLLRMRLN